MSRLRDKISQQETGIIRYQVPVQIPVPGTGTGGSSSLPWYVQKKVKYPILNTIFYNNNIIKSVIKKITIEEEEEPNIITLY